VLVPFSLRLTSPVRLLLLSLADDESCTDLEVQWVDDPDHGGQGAVLLAVRRDGTADVHVDRRLTLPRADYEVGAGTQRFGPAAMDPCRFEVTAAGVQVDLGLTLHDGRDLHLVVHEDRTSPPPVVRMLAPAGHAMSRPRFFPFFWMDHIWFLRWRGARVQVEVDGRPRRVVRMGAPYRLVRYATAPMTALWCEEGSGPVPVVPDEPGEHTCGAGVVTVEEADGSPAVASVQVRRGGAALGVSFDPAVPDLGSLDDGPSLGRWTAWASGRSQLGGWWEADRRGATVRLTQAVDEPWRPGPQPAAAGLVFRLLPVFRTWPTTYRWSGTVDLGSDPPTMTSGWSRT